MKIWIKIHKKLDTLGKIQYFLVLPWCPNLPKNKRFEIYLSVNITWDTNFELHQKNEKCAYGM